MGKAPQPRLGHLCPRRAPLSPEPSRPFPAAALTDVPFDGNFPEALLEAGVRGAGGVAAVPFGGGGHGGAERQHTGLPAAPAHFKSPASRWAGWPCPATTPREEAEALPPPPSRRVAAAPAPLQPGRGSAAAAARGVFEMGVSEIQRSFVQEVTLNLFHLLV